MSGTKVSIEFVHNIVSDKYFAVYCCVISSWFWLIFSPLYASLIFWADTSKQFKLTVEFFSYSKFRVRQLPESCFLTQLINCAITNYQIIEEIKELRKETSRNCHANRLTKLTNILNLKLYWCVHTHHCLTPQTDRTLSLSCICMPRDVLNLCRPSFQLQPKQ